MDWSLFLVDVATKPLWVWLLFLGLVTGLLAFDLGVLHKKDRAIGARESLLLSAGYVSAGLAFGAWVWHQFGAMSGMEYLTGFLIEKSLSLDNVFVIAMVFSFLAIPQNLQHRVLFWGILGAIAMRGAMVAGGSALISTFHWVTWVFGAFLVYTGVQMWRQAGAPSPSLEDNKLVKFLRSHIPMTNDLHGNAFLVRQDHAAGARWVATPLLLALLLVEAADVIFAVDSVPAIFAITSDPFIVYSSNIFAILGLRALYFALSAVLHRFSLLKYALALLLVFVGGKIFWAELVGKPPAWVTLGTTVAILGGAVALSLWRERKKAA